MSKINAVRFINLNYNNNAIRISDETFQLNGESTLFSLRNGGGKSVLVQMLIAPFVHKKYQNAKDRPFASYFTTNKPTFILVEWKLDQGAGYVLTGMMVRRNQEISEEQQEELEVVQFIAEYKQRCAQDIFHLPVVEKTKKEITLKGFHACKQLFETYKRERSIPFFYYDMNSSTQARQYFDKLMEYQINYKEWENIIKKVNEKESGLSDLFVDCKDEKGLVEKWFLRSIEKKLNKDRSRMKEFQGIMEKYTGQYKDNRSKIARRDTIQAFETEAKQIRERAVQYQETSQNLIQQEARIADFIGKLHTLETQEQQNADAVERRLEDIGQQLAYLEYEKLSGEIYEIADRERFHSGNLEMLRMEKQDILLKQEEAERKKNILSCAKQQENVAECQEECDKEYQRLLLSRVKEENLEPERNRLGAQLKLYYQAFYAEKENEKSICNQEIQQMEQERTTAQEKLEELRQKEGALAEQAGGFRAQIRAYDEIEDNFNQQYQEEWRRNILGEYDAGALQIRQTEYQKELEQTENARTKEKKEAERYKEQRKSMQRLLEDKTTKKIHLETAKQETQRSIENYQKELEERRVILQYFGIEQEDLFASDKILEAAQRRLMDTDLARRSMEQEVSVLEKEYRKMAQGQVLELSEEFQHLLEEAGIYYVYGMEWLRKNQFPAVRNQKLVEQNPFLPYALILPRKELERLSGLTEQVYTSFPVPIILREELEQNAGEQEGAVRSYAGLNFYIWFNDNLLDEEKLKQMLTEQQAQIEKLQTNIRRKKEEFTEYVSRREKIKNQTVTREAFQNAEETSKTQEQALSALEQEILHKREEMEAQETLQTQREQEIAALERTAELQKRRLSDFENLCRSYAQFQENSRLLEKNQKEKARVSNLQKLEMDKISKLEHQLVTQQNQLSALERTLENCKEKLVRYQQYAVGQETLNPENLEATAESTDKILPQDFHVSEAENRYEVITSGISAEQKELEARLEAAQKRFSKAQEELDYLRKKFYLTQADWAGIIYDRKEEAHQETILADLKLKLTKKEEQIHGEETQCALIAQEKQGKYTQMKERCQKEEPIAKEAIQTVDFTEAMKKLEYEQSQAKQEEKQIQKKLQGYENNLTALAEYEDFVCAEPVAWECDFAVMNSAELTKQKGILLRDYNAYTQQSRERRSELERILNQVIRKERFAEDFYQKPLESMLQLTADATRVLKQLETTIASYNSLMEKLMVDISMVEKEKAKIVELIAEYLKDVHDNLNKIDRNSTITIRERPVKMLKIELPDWTEQENLYQLRLQDYIDDITEKGIALLEENKNVQEYLGAKITTKALYDAVVGIGNVQIRLYKIEAQREYPITWAEVARNSGGEGFLSAFVILSALLYYMRKEETDMFADRNEGKVLLMDNPFAQTNASHLLKPLMDMAKKTNTQLICLSGLGGESIYNRFDNIYVLTLISANLRKDMQYLKAEHMRGSEEETMLVSQIQVMEQQRLF